jgi:lycopene beta-cyclase
VGLELQLSQPSPRAVPLLMDARVPQRDGYRFFYVLPFSADRVLIEDTYFSASPELDVFDLTCRILEYAEQNGYAAARVLRRETGVLPLPFDEAQLPESSGMLVAGYRGGFFHPTTGYSFPLAARVAELVAETSPRELVSRAWPELLTEHRRQFRFCLLLNRLLYGAFAPEDRHHVIERFYRLPEPVLGRFYAMTMTARDRARVFCDKPPRGFSLRLALAGGYPR